MVVLWGEHLVSHVISVIKSPPQEIDGKEDDKLSNPTYEEWYATDQ
jgi:hypothetical protein